MVETRFHAHVHIHLANLRFVMAACRASSYLVIWTRLFVTKTDYVKTKI